MPLTDQQRDDICAVARSYLGTPWHGQGRNHLGIDCVGIIDRAYIEAGLPLEPSPTTYRGVPSKHMVEFLLRFWRRIPYIEAKAADIVLYGVPWAAHLAILVPPRQDGAGLNGIHCPMGAKAVEARFDVKRGDIRGFYTWA